MLVDLGAHLATIWSTAGASLQKCITVILTDHTSPLGFLVRLEIRYVSLVPAPWNMISTYNFPRASKAISGRIFLAKPPIPGRMPTCKFVEHGLVVSLRYWWRVNVGKVGYRR